MHADQVDQRPFLVEGHREPYVVSAGAPQRPQAEVDPRDVLVRFDEGVRTPDRELLHAERSTRWRGFHRA
jgi:hypothetical protein